MSIAGALIGGAIGAFGKKPKVPELAPLDLNQIQEQTVAGNIASFADISKLAASANLFNQDQLNKLIDMQLPEAREQIASNLSSQLRGEVPADVGRAIQRNVASRGVSQGFGAQSGFGRSLEAEQFGLTSLGIMNNALSSAESWLKQSVAPMFDYTSMFFTPQQRLASATQQQGLKYQRDLLAAGVEAAPDPATAALGTEIDRFFNTAASAGMFAAGGGFGGMGGGGGGGSMGSVGSGLGGLGGMPSFSGAGGQGIGIMQSGFGGFGANYQRKLGFG